MEIVSVEKARAMLLEVPASEQAAAEQTADAQEETMPDLAEKGEEESRSYVDNSVGLGVDIVEIARMHNILQRSPSFATRVFSEDERLYCERCANPATHYALRFAAKEAVVKALGTGFSEGIDVRDIEVERAKNGRPSVKLSGAALQIAQKQGVRQLSLSLSYTHSDAVACAMAVTDSSVKATEKRKDPMEELALKFKEVRGMLDEL